MSKNLVILAGSPRGGERTWSSLKKYVIDHLDADLAICCSDKWNQDISLFRYAKYKWIFNEFDDYFQYYEKFFSNNWKNYLLSGKETGLLTSGSVHFVFKDMMLRQHMETIKKYEYIIYTRFDQLYVDYHPDLISNKILIPEGEDYFGICDRHAAFDSKFAENFFGICNFIDSNETLNYSSEHLNCETTFFNHMKNSQLDYNILRYPRTQFTASLKGEHTNWRVAKYKIYLTKKLMIKYPDEFMGSISNIIMRYGYVVSFFREPIYFLNYLYLSLRVFLGLIRRSIGKG